MSLNLVKLFVYISKYKLSLVSFAVNVTKGIFLGKMQNDLPGKSNLKIYDKILFIYSSSQSWCSPRENVA